MPNPERTEVRHVALFLADLHGGGAERMMVVLANGLADRGVRVDLVLADARGPYLREVKPAVRTIALGGGGVARNLPALVGYLRRERPQVLVSTLPHASVVALVARSLSGGRLPVVIREANTPQERPLTWSSPKSRLAAWLMQRWYRRADGVIAVSAGVADAVEQVMGVPREKIATLYNPVVTPEMHDLASEDPRHPWLEDEVPVVLAVGSLTPRKDYPTLVRAFAQLRARMPARLLVLGEGPERPRIEALATELGVASELELLGFRDNPYAYMARADVFAASSRLEGLPGALVQALACGCPAVATDCPSGPAEVLEGGALGELVPVGDANAMADALERTLRNPPDRARLRASMQKYDADLVIDAYHAYLSRSLRARTRGASRPG
jgi:glycosyltransferase involved in cell wall biosynthesis